MRKKTTVIAGLMIGAMLFSGFAAEDDKIGAPSRKPDVHFVPTPNEVVEIMLRLADVSKDDVVYDLGCGDGRIVIAAAKKAGCKAVGFDIDPAMVVESQKNVKREKVEELVTIKEADIFTLDLSEATVITLYLLPSLNVKLIPQLEKLPSGVRIVSHDFDMAGIRPDVIARVTYGGGDIHQHRKVYLWTTPLRKESELGPVSQAVNLEYPEPDPGAMFRNEYE